MRQSIKILLITAGLLVILAGLAGCGGGGDGMATPAVNAVTCPASATTDVSIQAAAFSPASVTVATSGIVKWTNNDVSTHTVTGAAGSFDAQVNPGISVCFQFTRAGTYNYSDTTNPSMTGSVTVTGAGGYGLLFCRAAAIGMDASLKVEDAYGLNSGSAVRPKALAASQSCRS